MFNCHPLAYASCQGSSVYTFASAEPLCSLGCGSAVVQSCLCGIWLLRLNLGVARGFEASEVICGLSPSWPFSPQALILPDPTLQRSLGLFVIIDCQRTFPVYGSLPFCQQLIARTCKDDVPLRVTECDADEDHEQSTSAEGCLAKIFREFLDSCCVQLECLGRSLFLMYCLALGRVLFGLTRLRKGQPRRNVRIVRARRFFSGAPLCLVFGIVAWCLPEA